MIKLTQYVLLAVSLVCVAAHALHKYEIHLSDQLRDALLAQSEGVDGTEPWHPRLSGTEIRLWRRKRTQSQQQQSQQQQSQSQQKVFASSFVQMQQLGTHEYYMDQRLNCDCKFLQADVVQQNADGGNDDGANIFAISSKDERYDETGQKVQQQQQQQYVSLVEQDKQTKGNLKQSIPAKDVERESAQSFLQKDKEQKYNTETAQPQIKKQAAYNDNMAPLQDESNYYDAGLMAEQQGSGTARFQQQQQQQQQQYTAPPEYVDAARAPNRNSDQGASDANADREVLVQVLQQEQEMMNIMQEMIQQQAAKSTPAPTQASAPVVYQYSAAQPVEGQYQQQPQAQYYASPTYTTSGSTIVYTQQQPQQPQQQPVLQYTYTPQPVQAQPQYYYTQETVQPVINTQRQPVQNPTYVIYH